MSKTVYSSRSVAWHSLTFNFVVFYWHPHERIYLGDLYYINTCLGVSVQNSNLYKNKTIVNYDCQWDKYPPEFKWSLECVLSFYINHIDWRF